MLPAHSLRPRAALASMVLTVLAVSCGGAAGDRAEGAASTDGKDRAGTTTTAAGGSACAKADTTPLDLAVRDYATQAMPSAQFFLSAFGTDSALPEDGFATLQDKGPSYFYGGDSVAKAKLRAKLLQLGPYNSLLVVYRGQTASADGNTVDVRLGGHYVAGKHEGEELATKRYSVRCDSTTWSIASTTEEPRK